MKTILFLGSRKSASLRKAAIFAGFHEPAEDESDQIHLSGD